MTETDTTDGATWTRLRRTSLREQAREAIRASIVSGAIEPGVIYSVPSIAAGLGVSVTPVREAMLDLSGEGLIESIRNRGFRITAASDHDLDEIFELRLLLEVPSMVKLCRDRQPGDLAPFRSIARANAEQARAGDVVGFLETDRELHLGLLARLGNRRLSRTVAQLRAQARLYGLDELARSGQLETSAREHADLLSAIVDGDRRRVESLTRHHLEHTRGIWAGRHEADGQAPAARKTRPHARSGRG